MKWDRPKPWDTRVVEKFLLFPKTINYQTRWLEKAKYKQMRSPWGFTGDYRWEDEEWVDD